MEAKEKIRKQLTDEKAKLLAYDHAESVYETIFDGDDLTKIAKDRNLVLRTTDYFTDKDPVKDIKDAVRFTTVALDLGVMQISELQDFEDGYYIIQVVDKIPEEIPELKLVEDRVRKDLMAEKQSEKAKADATAFINALKSGQSMSEATETFGVTPVTTGFFKRNDSIPGIGYETEIASAAFKLSGKKDLPENAIKGPKGYYVIKFRERKDPDTDAFSKEKKTIEENLMQLKKRQSFDAWLTEVRNKSEITIEKGFSARQ